MATDRTISFGSIVDRDRGSRKIWLVVIPVVLALLAILVFGLVSMGRTDAVKRDLAAARAHADELQKAIDERDRLLVQARENEDVLKSTGQAAAIFFAAAPGATESGIVFAHPQQHAATVYLWGLEPQQGRQYQVAARGPNGQLTALGAIIPSDVGTGFLVSRKVPQGASAVVLVTTPAGQEGLAQAEPRVTARYPTSPQERGILGQGPQVQARRGR